MLDALARYWWVPVMRGLAAILFGILAFTFPGAALATFILLFGAYALVDGIATIAGALGGRKTNRDWWLHLIGGIAGVAIGAMTFAMPGITALVLVYYIAAWAFVRGVFDVLVAIKLRKELRGEWILVLAGAASIAFAGVLIANPGPGAVALMWLIAAFAIVFGVLGVMLGFRLRGVDQRLHSHLRAAVGYQTKA